MHRAYVPSDVESRTRLAARSEERRSPRPGDADRRGEREAADEPAERTDVASRVRRYETHYDVRRGYTAERTVIRP